MGAVGGEFPFRLDCRSQPPEQQIDRTGDGMEFGRKGLCWQRCEIAAILFADVVAQGLYRSQCPAHDDDDGENAGGNEDENGKQQRGARLFNRLAAIGEGIGDLQEIIAVGRGDSEDALRRRLGKPWIKPDFERLRRTVMRMQHHLSFPVANLIGQILRPFRRLVELLRGRRGIVSLRSSTSRGSSLSAVSSTPASKISANSSCITMTPNPQARSQDMATTLVSAVTSLRVMLVGLAISACLPFLPDGVADAAHGLDAVMADFLAQPADIDLDRVAFYFRAEFVKRVVQLRFRDDRAGMFDEFFEHGPFPGAQRLRRSVNGDIARHLVDFDAGKRMTGARGPS
ncbi:hypothetical protein Ddc_21788 [Ditylenchus destructor]|nr:hypothetical protein Ddc_21788 [Ditylenchus destructor]